MTNETLQRIAAPLIVAAVIGAVGVAFKVTRLEEKVAALEKNYHWIHGDAKAPGP